MKVLIFYFKNIKMAEQLLDRFNINRNETDICDISCAGSIRNWANYEKIYIPWDCRMKLYSEYSQMGLDKVRLYNGDLISGIVNTEKIQAVQKQALQDKRWKVCKDINEFMIFCNAINEQSYLNTVPLKLQIETTDICNAKCIMCSHSYNPGSGKTILNSKLLTRLEPIFPFIKVIILHGNGEPFLLANITEYLDKMSSYGIRFITNTNLSILSDVLIERIRDSFEELNVSCDADEKELYEKIRVGLDFDQFVENVCKVRKTCPHLRMRMMVVLMKQNVHRMASMVEFASNLGFDEIVFNQLCMDEKNQNTKDGAYLYPEELMVNIKEAKRAGEIHGINVVLPNVDINEEDKKITSPKIKSRGICDWLLECPYIDLNGNVAFCCINQGKIIGNVFDKDLMEIWNNEQYLLTRQAFYQGVIPQFCFGCDFLVQNRLHYMSQQNYSLAGLRKGLRQ